MTVSSATTRNSYSGNASNDTFAYGLRYFTMMISQSLFVQILLVRKLSKQKQLITLLQMWETQVVVMLFLHQAIYQQAVRQLFCYAQQQERS